MDESLLCVILLAGYPHQHGHHLSLSLVRIELVEMETI